MNNSADSKLKGVWSPIGILTAASASPAKKKMEAKCSCMSTTW